MHLRSNAYAALGAAEVVTGRGQVQPAVELLDRASSLIATAARATIGWPETRLTYDNARIPEALIAAGIALGDARRTSLGIRLLDWLALNESQGNRFSFTPVGGREPGVHEPGFDQQPIEAWAMADACYRAWSVTGESRWARRALRAACWLLGNNDKDALLYDAESGGTFDGLTPDGVNLNQGGGIDAGRHRDTPGRGELLATSSRPGWNVLRDPSLLGVVRRPLGLLVLPLLLEVFRRHRLGVLAALVLVAHARLQAVACQL